MQEKGDGEVENSRVSESRHFMEGNVENGMASECGESGLIDEEYWKSETTSHELIDNSKLDSSVSMIILSNTQGLRA